MRGKELIQSNTDGLIRITPAYAGKSFPILFHFHTHKDHPRLCGEKPDTIRGIMTNIGSPPPMRGKGKRGKNNGNSCRITPAYAGKSFLSTSRAFCNQDHPRLCGEKQIRPLWRTWRKGSPPPMRGKETTPFTVSRMVRITPAYAGKSVIF